MKAALIFYVEDNERDVLLMKSAFADQGIAVDLVVADNALLAFRYLESREPYRETPRPPDLLVIDLNLPAIRGQVVLEEARKHAVLRSVPVVILTSSLDARELRRCLELGAAECINKPVTYDGYQDIVRRLQRHLPVQDRSGPRLASPSQASAGTRQSPSSARNAAPRKPV